MLIKNPLKRMDIQEILFILNLKIALKTELTRTTIDKSRIEFIKSCGFTEWSII